MEHPDREKAALDVVVQHFKQMGLAGPTVGHVYMVLDALERAGMLKDADPD